MAIMHSLYREAGTVTIDEETCKQCGQCAAICPAHVLVVEEGRVQVQQDSPFGCIACGHCMMVCPEESIAVTGRGISPADLVPLPPRGQRATADALAALMHARRSVRRFQDQEVEPALLEQIVEMASSAPMGIPPWDIGCVAVRGRDKVQELAGDVIKGYEGFLRMFRPWVLTLMRPFMGCAAYEQFRYFIRPLALSYVQNHRQGSDVLFWNAPAVLIFHHSPYSDVADAMIACTYAMLAAESLGLGNTIIGGAPPIIQRNRAICRRLGIPEGNKPSICLIVGHGVSPFKRALRRHFTQADTVT